MFNEIYIFILIIIQVSSGKDGSKKDVIMVDPVEAKRLAAKQMEKIKAKEKLKVKDNRKLSSITLIKPCSSVYYKLTNFMLWL